MADSGPSYAQQVASQTAQRSASEDDQDAFANAQRRQNDLAYASNGESPGYGAPGAMPKRDFGYEEFLNHVLGTTRFNQGIAINGKYIGKTQAEVIDLTRDDYPKLAPEERARFEQRAFNNNDRSPQEMQTQGFQYPEQTQRWGAQGPTWSSQDQNPSSLSAPLSSRVPLQQATLQQGPPTRLMNRSSSGQQDSAPQQQQAPSWNPGSMADSSNDTRPHFTGDPAGGSSSQPEMIHQRDAIPMGTLNQPPAYTRVNQGDMTTYNPTNVRLTTGAENQFDAQNFARQQQQGPPTPSLMGIVPHPGAQLPLPSNNAAPSYSGAGMAQNQQVPTLRSVNPPPQAVATLNR